MTNSENQFSAVVTQMPKIRVRVDALTQIRVNPALNSFLAAVPEAA
jgi:hypothetical protein